MSIGHAIGDAFAKLSTVLCGVKDDDDDKAPPAPVASAVSSSTNDVAVARAKIHAQADCGECGNCLDKPEYGGPTRRYLHSPTPPNYPILYSLYAFLTDKATSDKPACGLLAFFEEGYAFPRARAGPGRLRAQP